ncbi:hypothetical protein PMIN03_011821 [Paraphaeosphaeria minitans]
MSIISRSYCVPYNRPKTGIIRLARPLGKFTLPGLAVTTHGVWRPKLHQTADGPELLVVRDVVDAAFRDETGNATDHPGIQLRLSDFACQELTNGIIGDSERHISISAQELCQHLAMAEDKTRRENSLVQHSLPSGIRKRKRSETPSDRMASDDEAKYATDEQRVEKRLAIEDSDYHDTSITSLSE